jgi:hypothetical protein
VARGLRVICRDLNLGQRKEIGLIFGLQLNGFLQVLPGGGEVLSLNHFEEVQQMMSWSEVRHQRQQRRVECVGKDLLGRLSAPECALPLPQAVLFVLAILIMAVECVGQAALHHIENG